MTTAFDTFSIGGHVPANGILMSPMTRSRAYGSDASPTTLMATY